MASHRILFRGFLLCFLGIFLLMLVLGYKLLSEDDGLMDLVGDVDYHDNVESEQEFTEDNGSHVEPPPDDPIIIWWTPFTGERGKSRKCGENSCFFTVDRYFQSHKNTKVFMFYGTDINIGDLPVPREPHHEWALLHEESPKNVYLYSHSEMMQLFNMTSTFKRESNFPLTTQYLEGTSVLEGKKYLLSFDKKTAHQRELALVNYVQSDCNTPSDRDHFVQMLQQYIKVDSYGACEHNKDMPVHLRDPLKGMEHEDFFKLTAKYKFTLAMENGVCDDYITEKLWRPLVAGSVPIVFGSPKIKDFLPTEKSAIVVDDYKSMKDLVNTILQLNVSKQDYEEYLSHKNSQIGVTNKLLRETLEHRGWGYNDWTKPNFIEMYECEVCNMIHDNLQRQKNGLPKEPHLVTADHYGCPKPKKFRGFSTDITTHDLDRVDDEWSGHEWNSAKYQARAILQLVLQRKPFKRKDVLKLANLLQYQEQDDLF